MKKFKLTPFAIALLAASISFAHAKESKFKELTPEQVKQLPVVLRQGYKSGMFKVMDTFKVPNTKITGYAVYSKAQGNGVFYTENGYLIIGSLIDKKGQNLTNLYLKKYAVPKSYSDSIKYLKEAHTVKFGKGKTKLVVFVDPRCPHCVKDVLNRLLRDKSLSEKYTMTFVPVGFVAPNSDEMSASILDEASKGKSFIKAWEEAIQKGNQISNTSGTNVVPVIQDNMKVMAEMGINQTPTVIRHDEKTKEWVADNTIFRP